ncbi:MAG TPA: formate dehydrogenase subunit gamma [Acidobacteriota bacterium]|nr:formate dehydrogenase subunit gamma [Acidobacteriota bacterium]
MERFSFRERVVHWAVAISFVYVTATGLSLWSHKLLWLSTIFGGGEATRWGHPWGGVAFAVILGVMFVSWARQMRVDDDDRRWLRRAHRYASNDTAGMPESGRFHGGQKMLFWAQTLAALALLGSGLVMWFAGTAPRGLAFAALLIHPIAAVVAIGGIILHVYMAVAAIPGSLRAMTRGSVSAHWAAAHHAKWYAKISGR